ncbi:MAG: hypothetical protein M1828_005660 [Chrysothrix sp. TS-e1954]|nr:MAG: hypothetical protein M1828_005660 [Chrysothrix sp. TS-e1954]
MRISGPLGPVDLSAEYAEYARCGNDELAKTAHGNALGETSFFSSQESLRPEPAWKPLPVRPGLHHRAFRWWTKQSWWPTDTFNAVLSLVIFGSVVTILAVFEGQPNPEFKFGITLNALISVLATLGTFTIMIPCSDALAQLKWTWFIKERPLEDFHVIENASRGPTGSLLLLIKRRGGLLAATGATLTILILAINPFVQQVIRYEGKLLNATEASMPIAHHYDTFGGGTSDSLPPYADLSMQGAVLSGLLDTDLKFQVKPSCATGSCTWSSYQTLSVCSKCVDITNRVAVGNVTSENLVGAPPHLTFDLPDKVGFDIGALNNSDSGHFLKVAWGVGSPAFRDLLVLADTTALWVEVNSVNKEGVADANQGYQYRAAECVLYWGVKTMSATMRNGTFEETELDDKAWTNNTNTQGIVWGDFADGGLSTSITPPGQNEAYTVSAKANHALSLYFLTFFNATVPKPENGVPQGIYEVGTPENPTDSIFPDEESQAIWNAFATEPHTLDALMENMAQSMNVNIRTRSNAGLPFLGQQHSVLQVISVEWPWLILPLVMLIATFGFLSIVALNTRKQQFEAWRTNSLATLVHGLDEHSKLGLRDREAGLSLEEASEGLVVRMLRGPDGWRLTRVD